MEEFAKLCAASGSHMLGVSNASSKLMLSLLKKTDLLPQLVQNAPLPCSLLEFIRICNKYKIEILIGEDMKMPAYPNILGLYWWDAMGTFNKSSLVQFCKYQTANMHLYVPAVQYSCVLKPTNSLEHAFSLRKHIVNVIVSPDYDKYAVTKNIWKFSNCLLLCKHV